MVKWLEEITVSAEPSDNFYHFHDNRVLPSHVTEKMAKDEGAAASLLAMLLQLANAMHIGNQAKGTKACAVPSMMWTRKRETTLEYLMDRGPGMTQPCDAAFVSQS